MEKTEENILESIKKQSDLVSIIVPCYNIEKYVRRCINSILMQTYKNIEVLAVDDGSTDKTGHILEELAKKDERLIVTHYENGGPSVARNHGLDMIRGSYVMCVDGDDWIDKKMLESMILKAKTVKANLVVCNYFLYYSADNQIIGDNKTDDIDSMSAEEAICKLFDGVLNYVSPWAKLYKSNLWTNLRYPENFTFGEDMFLAPILFDRAQNICYIKAPLYYYNQEGVSLVRSDFNLNKLQMIKATKNWVDFCKQKYPEIQSKAEDYNYLVTINMCSHLITPELREKYEKLRVFIKKNYKKIKQSNLKTKEKIKACLIIHLSNKQYRFIRIVMNNIVNFRKLF